MMDVVAIKLGVVVVERLTIVSFCKILLKAVEKMTFEIPYNGYGVAFIEIRLLLGIM